MGSEMDAAMGAYDDIAMMFLLLVGVVWLAVGVLIMRGEEIEDGR